ncbi:MAG: hypothetical protein A2Z14_10990 [Chloroflexi bacterium RBG_16_48_8]|nr:MAG: hypothetical protein A2Z14_10990 [Chloroflexi bacterium RBG_16_48_8]
MRNGKLKDIVRLTTSYNDMVMRSHQMPSIAAVAFSAFPIASSPRTSRTGSQNHQNRTHLPLLTITLKISCVSVETGWGVLIQAGGHE